MTQQLIMLFESDSFSGRKMLNKADLYSWFMIQGVLYTNFSLYYFLFASWWQKFIYEQFIFFF